MADDLQNLLDFLDETGMVDRLCQLNVTKMARTLAHGLGTGRASELSIDGSELGVVETTGAGCRLVLFHGLGVKNMADTHVLDLLGGHDAELNLFDRLERRARVGEVEVSHGGDFVVPLT